MQKIIIPLLIFLYLNNSPAQVQDRLITVRGDSLMGRFINGESVREVHGNVLLTHGNINITCNTAVQYIARNNAELIGNVIVKQDSITITAKEGFYFGDEKRSLCTTGVKLDDKKIILTAVEGEYFFNDDIAYFKKNVTLYDSAFTLTADKLTYIRKEGKAVAVGNVKVIEKDNVIYSDSLIHFRDDRITIAENNVKIIDYKNNVTIFSNHLEDYRNRDYSLIEKNPLFIQIDTTKNGNVDTLIIKSIKMESFRDTLDTYKAIDSVEIISGAFSSKNDVTIFNRKDDKITTFKEKENSALPILWNENSQLSGDSITVFLIENKIDKVEVNRNAFALSQSEKYSDRFDQTSGSRLLMFFKDSRLIRTEVYGGVLSIYYLFEEKAPNGLTKSSAQSAVLSFNNNEVDEVKLFGSPVSEYYPENQVEGKELSFTLPQYRFYKNRPAKKNVLLPWIAY